MFIPFIAVGSGISLTVWGVKKIINNDDSADKKVAAFISSIPENILKYIEVGWDKNGPIIRFKLYVSAEQQEFLEKEIKNNVIVQNNNVDKSINQ